MKPLNYLLITLGLVISSCAGNQPAQKAQSDSIPLITLNNGVQMPQLGFGTWTLVDDATQSVKSAVEAGYRMFDSAQGYGNEAQVYQGIKESGIDRKEVFITTKISPDNMRNGTVRESLEKSLESFGGEYIDLVLIHWPVKEHIKETWQIMEEFVEAGKVRSIGVSNFNPHHIDELLTYAKIKPAINQIELHPYLSQQEVVGYTFDRDIYVQGWSPLGSGKNGALQDERLIRLAKKHNKSVAQIILRWNIQRGIIAIPRSNKPNEIAENINIFDFELSPVDMAIINGMNRGERVNEKNDPDNFPW